MVGPRANRAPRNRTGPNESSADAASLRRIPLRPARAPPPIGTLRAIPPPPPIPPAIRRREARQKNGQIAYGSGLAATRGVTGSSSRPPPPTGVRGWVPYTNAILRTATVTLTRQQGATSTAKALAKLELGRGVARSWDVFFFPREILKEARKRRGRTPGCQSKTCLSWASVEKYHRLVGWRFAGLSLERDAAQNKTRFRVEATENSCR